MALSIVYIFLVRATIVPATPGDVYSVNSVTMGAPTAQSGTGNPLNAVIGTVPALVNGVAPPNAGMVALVYNALNMTFAGVLVTVSDSDGEMAYMETVNGVVDQTPTAIMLGPTVTMPQPAPTM
jgi:hypothetical protein